MIISRSPLRISFGGGGTDLPSYFREHEGYVIAGAINKYVYVTCSRPFTQEIILKYSGTEKTKQVLSIKHPIIREALHNLNLKTPQIEIASFADIPAGTGLGSSGSFTTALIKALYVHYRKSISAVELAELACSIEIDQLKEPVGKQDQYIATFGGISEFHFGQSGAVSVKPLKISVETVHDLEDNLLLFFTGISRSASAILIDQVQRTEANDKRILKDLHKIKEIGFQIGSTLVEGNTKLFGELMLEHWNLKKYRSKDMSNDSINNLLTLGIKNGAIGGKLVGAGGGGFLMFYASDPEKLRLAMTKQGLEEVRFAFDYEGTKVIMS